MEAATDGGSHVLKKESLFFKLFILVFLSVITTTIKAQWIRKDSLEPNQGLRNEGNIRINPNEIKNIQFSSDIINRPINKFFNSNIAIDETLPLKKKKVVLTLTPYKPTTPYNWDPIFHCNIIQVHNHWEPIISPAHFTDQARAVDMAKTVVNALPDLNGIKLSRSGAYINGTTIGGLDLMFLFEKRFLDRKGEARRARTLELLKQYSDTLATLKSQLMTNDKQK